MQRRRVDSRRSPSARRPDRPANGTSLSARNAIVREMCSGVVPSSSRYTRRRKMWPNSDATIAVDGVASTISTSARRSRSAQRSNAGQRRGARAAAPTERRQASGRRTPPGSAGGSRPPRPGHRANSATANATRSQRGDRPPRGATNAASFTLSGRGCNGCAIDSRQPLMRRQPGSPDQPTARSKP